MAKASHWSELWEGERAGRDKTLAHASQKTYEVR